MNSPKKRIEVILKNPNPLFEKWLQKWLEQAEAKGSKSRFTLREALESLRKFPLLLTSGRDCKVLRGFGTTLCRLIDQELELHEKQPSSYDAEVRDVVKSVQKAQKQKARRPQAKRKPAEVVDEQQVFMSPGSFRIVLLVDTQETNGKTKKSFDETRAQIESHKLEYEVRRLSVGDFAWVCRDAAGNELVLPYIVERKRMDDFASSIRDGRFHEQKFRLRDCGVPHLIYLIENYGNNQHVGLPMPTLMQAAVNTEVHSGFKIKFTDTHRDSIFYLNVFTRILIRKFRDKILIGTAKDDLQPGSDDVSLSCVGLMKFDEFQQSSVKGKNLKVKDVFLKQLLQLKSLSAAKAIAITAVYSTPKALIAAYQRCASKAEAEQLLTAIPSGPLKRPVGAAISKVVYDFYNSNF